MGSSRAGRRTCSSSAARKGSRQSRASEKRPAWDESEPFAEGEERHRHRRRGGESAGRHPLPIRCDVSAEPETKAAVAAIAKSLGGIHVLVNAAAVRDPTASVTDLDLAAWNKVFAVNVGGAYLMSR